MYTLIQTPFQTFRANESERWPDRDENEIPAELDAFMVSYPTDCCPHFATFTVQVGRLFFNGCDADDDIREVEVCHDCGAWVVDPHEGREYPTPAPVMEVGR